MAELLPSCSVEPSVVPVIKVVGVGDAGANIVAALAGSGALLCFACNTDARAGARHATVDTITFGRKITRGMSAGGEPERGRAAAEEDEAKFAGACSGASVVLIVAGMGGGTGTGAAPVVARAARRTGAVVLAFVVMPFGFEGRRRQRLAQAGIEHLQHEADAVVVVDNEKMLQLVGEAATLAEGFRAANALLAEGIRSVGRLLSSRGLIQLDFASLAAVFRGRHMRSAIAIAEAAGPGRVQIVTGKLLAGPMLDPKTLSGADTLLVSIVGGPDLSMAEVNELMQEISRHCPKTNVMVGAAIEPAFAGRLEVALIASARGEAPDDTGEFAEAPETGQAEPAPRTRPAVDAGFLNQPGQDSRPRRAIRPPPPELTPEAQQQLISRRGKAPGRTRRRGTNAQQQQQLPLDIVSRGRFEKSEPTLYNGEDLDVPTFIRRGMVLN